MSWFAKLSMDRPAVKIAALVVVFLLLLQLIFSIYWSLTPDFLPDKTRSEQYVVGQATTETLIEVAQTLLSKPGGFIENDHLPPGVFLDNMPNWEIGVLFQIRDLARALRNDMSRSQSQSKEDVDLVIATPAFNIDSSYWMFPSAEGEYQKGIDALQRYHDRLMDTSKPDGQFYARADNLVSWLMDVEKRLGGLSQRLSASVAETRINTDLAGDPAARQSGKNHEIVNVRTPWTEIDDVFYQARGSCWALLHFLKAVEVDFQEVLVDKNALISLRQIIRELEATQGTVWSPMILNGGGFGLFANHSLVMASYISRANAALIDLRNLLTDG